MLGTLARGTYLLVLATMIVAWVISFNREAPAEPQPQPSEQTWQIEA